MDAADKCAACLRPSFWFWDRKSRCAMQRAECVKKVCTCHSEERSDVGISQVNVSNSQKINVNSQSSCEIATGISCPRNDNSIVLWQSEKVVALQRLFFRSGTVDGDHATVCVLDLYAGGIDIELTRNNFLFHNSVLLNLFLFSWASWFWFRSLDNTVSEMGLLEFLKENNKSEPISHREDLVRIILVWCRWWDSNPHGIATNGFWVRHVYHSITPA